MRERRNDLEIRNEIPQIALQIPNSDRSPLYDVRNPASASCEGRDMRSDVSRTMIGALFRQPVFALRATPGTLRLWLRVAQPSVPKANRGGARRDRTDDLMLAKHALSQLSYGPVPEDECSALDQSGGPGKT